MFDLGAQPQHLEDWVALARRQCASARILLKNRQTADAWNHAGFAVECMLKAAIMRRERFNSWPSDAVRGDLYTHNLTYLAEQAGIVRQALVRDPIAPKWQVVLLWGRSHTYNPKAMPFKVAADMVKAACGQNGVIEWIAARFQITV